MKTWFQTRANSRKEPTSLEPVHWRSNLICARLKAAHGARSHCCSSLWWLHRVPVFLSTVETLMSPSLLRYSKSAVFSSSQVIPVFRAYHCAESLPLFLAPHCLTFPEMSSQAAPVRDSRSVTPPLTSAGIHTFYFVRYRQDDKWLMLQRYSYLVGVNQSQIYVFFCHNGCIFILHCLYTTMI